MKRLVLIFMLMLGALLSSAQEVRRFSPSWTFQVPGATKAELEERAYKLRMQLDKEVGMAEMYMYDTRHYTIWILSTRHTPELGQLHSLISTYIAFLPEDGSYTVNIELLNITAYNGVFRISDDINVPEDDSEYCNNKKVFKVIQDAKTFAVQQVENLLPLIREKMETQEIQFNLVQAK